MPPVSRCAATTSPIFAKRPRRALPERAKIDFFAADIRHPYTPMLMMPQFALRFIFDIPAPPLARLLLSAAGCRRHADDVRHHYSY